MKGSPILPIKHLLAKIRESDRVLISFILLVALILRIRGIDLLLPYFESGPDERYLIDPALKILKTGDLNPHFFWYGSFPIYWTALLNGLVLGVRCWVSGGINTIGECIKNFGIYDQGFLLFYLGRATSIVFGLGTIYLLYLLGRRFFNRETGLLASLFLALSPLHIYFSQIFKVDISLLFWILLALYFSIKIYEGGSAQTILGAGIACGLALGTKYNFLIFFPLLLVFLRFRREPGKRVRQGLLVLYISAMVFLLTCPYIFLNFPGFIHDISIFFSLPGLYIYGNISTSSFLPLWLYRLIFLFPFYFGPLIFLVSLGGVYLLFRSDWYRGIIFVSFPVAYFIFSSFFSRYIMPQYQFPLLPFVILLGSFLIINLQKSASPKLRLSGWVVLVFSILFFLSDLIYPHFYGVYHSYREAGNWVEKNIAPNRRVLTYWWVYSPTNHFGFTREDYFAQAGDLSVEKFKQVNPDWAVLVDSRVFRNSSYAPVLGKYGNLLSGLKTGEIKGYRLRKEFSPDPLWEKVAGYLYHEFSGFRIMIYEKG